MNILVTGASGFVGSNLIKKLYSQGSNLYITINKSDNINYPVKKIHYDGSFNSLYDNLRESKIDVIIHLATRFIPNHDASEIDELLEANVKLGAFLLELTMKLEIPCFISTSTYAQRLEGNSYNPQNLYAATKQAFETLMKYYDEVTKTIFITLELSDTYGPGDTRSKFINHILSSANEKTVLKMSPGHQEISYVYIDDIIDAYMLCVELFNQNIITESSKYSVYSEEVFSLNALVEYVAEKLNIQIESDAGYYSYREREIMKYSPSYPKIPGWSAKVKLSDGIKLL